MVPEEKLKGFILRKMNLCIRLIEICQTVINIFQTEIYQQLHDMHDMVTPVFDKDFAIHVMQG